MSDIAPIRFLRRILRLYPWSCRSIRRLVWRTESRNGIGLFLHGGWQCYARSLARRRFPRRRLGCTERGEQHATPAGRVGYHLRHDSPTLPIISIGSSLTFSARTRGRLRRQPRCAAHRRARGRSAMEGGDEQAGAKRATVERQPSLSGSNGGSLDAFAPFHAGTPRRATRTLADDVPDTQPPSSPAMMRRRSANAPYCAGATQVAMAAPV
jgi:hypothetical protein